MSDPTPQPPKRKRAKGRTLGMGEAQLDAESKVTPADTDSARDWWKRHAPKKLAGLLSAVLTTDEPKP